MRMHRLIAPGLLAFSLILPGLGASQSRDKPDTPLFWLSAPDSRPGAFFQKKAWQAKDVFGRAAVRTHPADEMRHKSVVNPRLPSFCSGDRPDFFATTFCVAQDGGEDPLHGVPPGQLPAAPDDLEPRRTMEPSLLAGTGAGIAIFVVGSAGWIALALGAFILERKQAAAKPS